MIIVPISGLITPLNPISPNDTTAAEQINDYGSFLDVFKGVLDNAVEATAQKDQDAISVMLGEIDDLHTIQANIEKAVIAVDLLVSVRDKALDAYNEVMRMNL